jgi:hypothetical protein
MDLKEAGGEIVDRIHLVRGRFQWWALVNTIMDLWIWIPKRAGYFWTN